MNPTKPFMDTKSRAERMKLARVLTVYEEDAVLVAEDGDMRVVCDVLQTSGDSRLQLAPGDTVLIWTADDEQQRGVVLGRIGPSRATVPEVDTADEILDEIVIEARKNLTLKCGEGSITLREDGKVLIKGKDLVSRAQRMNRVKGGAVSIN